MRKRLCLAGAAAMLFLSAGMPVTAAETGTDAPQKKAAAVTFSKYLYMRKDAEVPDVAFQYSISPGQAQPGDPANGILPVFAGDDKDRVTGAPVIADGQAVFAPGNETEAASGNEKYVRREVEIDFSAVTYKEPGVYRYIVTEDASALPVPAGIIFDEDPERVLDVYVVNDEESTDAGAPVKTAAFVLHNMDAGAQVKADGSSQAGAKSEGFVNRYSTVNLQISKTVSGNQASREEYFEFTLTLSHAAADTEYAVTGEYEAQTKVTAVNKEAKTNPSSIKTGKDGSASATFYLRHGQNIVISGLPGGTAYSVSENAAVLNAEGYTASAKITGDTKTGEKDEKAVAMTDQKDEKKPAAVEDTGLSEDTAVAWQNDRGTVVPTGVAVNFGAGLLALVLGIAGAAGIIIKRRRRAGTALLLLMLAGTAAVPARAASVETDISVKCEADRYIDKKEVFTITLTEDGSPYASASATSLSLHQGESGSFTLTFTYPGTYHYSVSQKKGTNREIVYDTSVYKIDVYVTETETGSMTATPVIYKGSIQPKLLGVSFANKSTLGTEEGNTENESQTETETQKTTETEKKDTEKGGKKPENNKPGGSVKTGDDTPVMLWTWIFLGSVLLAAVLVTVRKRKKS